MSFILDQLKKSGKKRALELAMLNKTDTRVGKPGEKSQAASPPVSGRGIHLRGSQLLLLAVVLSAVMGGFMLYRGKPADRRTTPVAAKEMVVRPSAPADPRAEDAAQKPALPADRGTAPICLPRSGAGPEKKLPAPTPVEAQQVAKIRKPLPPAATAEPRKQAPPADHRKSAAASVQEEKEMQDNAQRIPYLNELPAALQNALPPVRMTSHLYRGNSRLVNINGRIMSQGVTMDDGLFLEEITQEGVILSFRGHRFRVRTE